MPEKPAAKPVKPVKSAKDVINAMYASGAAKLPDPSQTKKSPLRAPRPARASLKPAPSITPAKSATSRSSTTSATPKPVVRPEVSTSLKLNPKKPTIVRAPRVVAAPRKMMDLRPAKGSTQLAISAIKKAAASATPKKPTKPPVNPAPRPVARPAANNSQHLVDDIRRPAPTPSPTPAETLQTVAERLDRSEKKTRLRPLDSIKNRFRPAPKGFSAREADQIRPLNVQKYHSPDFEPTIAPTPSPTPARETIHLYGMTEGTDTFASAPDLIEPDQTSSDDTNLGVIEDYHPASAPSATPDPSNPNPAPRPVKPTAPDNNRYALGGQSPFFLKSITVEKRPLSDAPVVRRPSESSVYSAQNLSDDTSSKNAYSKKSKKFLKSKTVHPTKSSDSALNTRPTVIVPARRRSHAPLFVLLIVTVILGAVVGAAVYLFLFQ